MVWRLATSNPDLRAAVPFYGANPPIADVAKIKAAVLAIYGELDSRIGAGIPAIREAMQNARIVHDIVIYTARPARVLQRHRPELQRGRGQGRWIRTLAWFDQYLKGA